GADEECDIQIGPEHAERIATLALEENVPIILDVSGYLDDDAASDLIRETARHLFAKEKKLKKPFLLIVEECHEYIPEGGGMDETGRMLIKIGKRGRKHGLGIVGVSQRPADVKKDFITQANWLVWHRLTWENDTKVVKRVVDDGYADRVTDLPDGRAFVQSDWTDRDVMEVQFRRKHTFDAGATPGLDDFERPELKSVSDNLVGDLAEISERKQTEDDRIAALERKLQEREGKIDDLERQLESAQDVSDAARQMAAALTGDIEVDRSEYEERLMEKDREINDLRGTVSELAAERDRLQARVEELESGPDEQPEESESASEDRIDALERTIEAKADRIETVERDRREKEARIEELERALADRAETIGDLEGTIEEQATTIDRLREQVTTDRPAADESPTGESTPESQHPATENSNLQDEDQGSVDLEASAEWPTADADSADTETTRSSQTTESNAAVDPLDPSRRDAEVLEDDHKPTADRRRTEKPDHELDPTTDDDGMILGSEGAEGNEQSAASEGKGHQGADQTSVDEAVQEAMDEEEVEESAEDGKRNGEIIEEQDEGPDIDPEDASLVDLILADPVTERILMAYREAKCNERHTWEIVSALATRAPMTARDVGPHTDAQLENVQSLLGELRTLSLVKRFDDGRWAFDRSNLEAIVENPQRVDGLDDPDIAQRIE
ncbi:MAG: putative coiled-coil protein SlyX, partial [Halobacteriales archaeon]